MMFQKILIANRGEIAVRIIRACRELGIRTVAVASEVDADALHSRMADEVAVIGPAPPLESYLVMEKVIGAALEKGCQAIHPGYGFLAENASFAGAVEEAGLTFIGPTSPSILPSAAVTAPIAAMVIRIPRLNTVATSRARWPGLDRGGCPAGAVDSCWVMNATTSGMLDR